MNKIVKNENGLPAKTEKTDPIIGIAFGGGGIRGLAHFAVMEKFKELGIRADMVSGTSIGSGIAAMYANGKYGKEISEKVLAMDFHKLFPLGGKNGKIGLSNGEKYAKTMVDLIGAETFEQLPIPLWIISVDLVHWKKFIHDSGSLQLAIQASSALPGAFAPVEYGDCLLSDGGAVDNCPAEILKEKGADIVIAVDLDYRDYSRPKNAIDVVKRFSEIVISNGRMAGNADVVIKPFEGYVAALALGKGEYCYELGKKAVEEKTPEILRVIENWYDERGLVCPDIYQPDSYMVNKLGL